MGMYIFKHLSSATYWKQQIPPVWTWNSSSVGGISFWKWQSLISKCPCPISRGAERPQDIAQLSARPGPGKVQEMVWIEGTERPGRDGGASSSSPASRAARALGAGINAGLFPSGRGPRALARRRVTRHSQTLLTTAWHGSPPQLQENGPRSLSFLAAAPTTSPSHQTTRILRRLGVPFLSSPLQTPHGDSAP